MDGFREAIFEVRDGETTGRLDSYLAQRLKGLSRQRIQALIREQLTPLGTGRLKPGTSIWPGLRFSIRYAATIEPPLPSVPVVFEDAALLVVDKPAGLAVHPAGRHHDCTLTGALAARAGPRADPAHRLDRETSGLLACGIGSAATSILKRAFAAGTIEKSYLAICEGWPTTHAFTIDAPLELGAFAVRVRMRVGRGKAASTEVSLRRRFSDPLGRPLCLLSCSPRTGRQHQIRAHLAAAGLPIVGDKIYGFDERAFIRFTEGATTPEDREKLRLPRHALHAAELRLHHPTDERPLAFTLPLPPDLSTFLSTLEAVD